MPPFSINTTIYKIKIPMSQIKRKIDFNDDMHFLQKSFTKAHEVIIKNLIESKECQEYRGTKKR